MKRRIESALPAMVLAWSLLGCSSDSESSEGEKSGGDLSEPAGSDFGGATDYGESEAPDRGPCQGQCENSSLSSCTCDASDPCGWAQDGVCDAAYCTAASLVDDTFDDGDDCDGAGVSPIDVGGPNTDGGAGAGGI